MAALLNRYVRLSPSGTFLIPNIPVPTGQVRVRIVCELDGVTSRAHSSFITPAPNQFNSFPDIRFDLDPDLPLALELSAPNLELGPDVPSVQITTTGVFPGGVRGDLSPAVSGTSYLSSNPRIATVSEDGLVTALASGPVLVTATFEGVIATIRLDVSFGDDRDADGLPDSFEALYPEAPGGANLARAPGALFAASSSAAGFEAARAFDGTVRTAWRVGGGDAAPRLEVTLAEPGPVAQVQLRGLRDPAAGTGAFASGTLRVFAANDAEVLTRPFELAGPFDDAALAVDINAVARVVVEIASTRRAPGGFSEVRIVSGAGGPGLDPDDPADASRDFDFDGRSTLEEFASGTSPFAADTDADELTDDEEIALGSEPLGPDTDGDGLVDGNEVDPAADTDDDGTINLFDTDSDGDQLPDGGEVRVGLSPVLLDSDNDGTDDLFEDPDFDLLNNFDELFAGSDFTRPDSDDDGFIDGEEVAAGSDPTDRNSRPELEAPPFASAGSAWAVAVRNDAASTLTARGQPRDVDRLRNAATRGLSVRNDRASSETPRGMAREVDRIRNVSDAVISVRNDAAPTATGRGAPGPEDAIDSAWSGPVSLRNDVDPAFGLTPADVSLGTATGAPVSVENQRPSPARARTQESKP